VNRFMDHYSPRIRSLLRQADKVASSGKRSAAKQLYKQILDEAPETAHAWHGLAQITLNPSDQSFALARALELDPSLGQSSESTEPRKLEQEPGADNRKLADRHESSPNEIALSETESGKHLNVPVKDRDSRSRVDTVKSSGLVTEHLDHPIDRLSQGGMKYQCINHPKRETSLRCNRCDNPICSQCAILIPVGYRCPQCIKEREDIYFNARSVDYVFAAVVSIPLSIVGAMIAFRLGSLAWGILMLLISPAIGSMIGGIVFRVVGRRRGRWIPHLVSGAVIFGGIIVASPTLALLLKGGINIMGLLLIGIYIVMASGSAYYRMK